MRNWLVLILAAVVLAGCANGYAKFYKPVPEGALTIPSQEEPVVFAGSGDPKQDVAQMFVESYGLVGVSEFNGAAQKHAGAIAQAKKVGANRIILDSKYRNTQSGVMPMTTPTVSTAYTSGTVYGGVGSSARYSGMTTMYGSETTYIPYSVDRFDQRALYFAPLPRKGVGIQFILATNETRQAAGTNKGYQIMLIRRGSPAFRADFLPGDLVVMIGGRDIVEPRDYRAALVLSQGQDTEFVLYRGATRLVKQMRIPEEDETW